MWSSYFCLITCGGQSRSVLSLQRHNTGQLETWTHLRDRWSFSQMKWDTWSWESWIKTQKKYTLNCQNWKCWIYLTEWLKNWRVRFELSESELKQEAEKINPDWFFKPNRNEAAPLFDQYTLKWKEQQQHARCSTCSRQEAVLSEAWERQPSTDTPATDWQTQQGERERKRKSGRNKRKMKASTQTKTRTQKVRVWRSSSVRKRSNVSDLV